MGAVARLRSILAMSALNACGQNFRPFSRESYRVSFTIHCERSIFYALPLQLEPREQVRQHGLEFRTNPFNWKAVIVLSVSLMTLLKMRKAPHPVRWIM